MGKVLHINLSKNRVKKTNLSESLAENFIGGRGLNSSLLYNEIVPGIDALNPDNPLIFGAGPLNGTSCPGSSRWTVTAKSPLTGILGDASCGSRFGLEMKFSGFDQIVVKGRAEKPVYICIIDDKVEIKNAEHLWGKATDATVEMIKKDMGDNKVQISTIGPAGENLVRFASIISNSRAAARCGMGAVMGSKNLKAIAIRGSREVKVAKPEELEKVGHNFNRKILEDPTYKEFSYYGTPILLGWNSQAGWLTTKNTETQFFEDAHKIDWESFLKQKREYSLKRIGCSRCIINCTHHFSIKEGSAKLEFGHIEAFGSNCLNSDLSSILKSAVLSNQLGVDAYSMGCVIGFAMECYEKGLITLKDTGELKLTWGNPEAIIDLIRLVAYREKIGNILAEGVKKASEKIGKGAENFAQHTKELEALGMPPLGYGLGFATSTRGFDHLRGLSAFEGNEFLKEKVIEIFGTSSVVDPYTVEGKPLLVKWSQELMAVLDSLETCKFYCAFLSATGPEDLAQLLSAVTGIPINGKELLKIGERIYNLERMFNVREGISRKDDTLPSKLFRPIPSGPIKGFYCSKDNLSVMLDEYYELRGWSKDGIPTIKKKTELELS